MSDDATLNHAGLSLSVLRRIDDCSARFEAAWSAGETPSLEDFLADVAEPERTALFRELFLSELELRKARQASLDESVYQQRFPQYGGIIHAAFADATGNDDSDDALSFLQPPGRPDSLGRLGHFEVLQVLGQGGFGVVLRAFDDVLQRVVAIKVMLPQLAATSPPRKRFLREARSAAGVHHDNVVHIHAVEEQPIPYLVMEYIQGETLQQRLDRNGPLEVPDVLRIGQHIASGLAAAHALELIHRDIKPGNILLESDVAHRVKITDFGLARTADDASLTQSGFIAGTPMYMAPEQAQGEAIDQRIDLFSLGSVLYVMCTGRPPFRAATTVAVLKRVVEDTPRPIREIIPEVPQWLVDLISKLHAKDPADRFQSAKEVADLLGHYLMELQVKGHIHDRVRVEKPAPARRPAPAKSAALVPPRSRRHRWTIVAVLALVLVGLGAAVVKWLSPDGKSRTAPPPTQAPFHAEQARAHQVAWAGYLDTQPVTTNSIGMKMSLIPPGTFLMGAPDDEPMRDEREGPRREVRLTRPFTIGVHPVTVGQFKVFVNEEGYKTEAEASGLGARVLKGDTFEIDANATWRNPGFEQTDDHPVVCVSWNDARAFCDWLSRKEQKTYALPTEAQWEYACRAGTQTRFSFGEDERELSDHVWHEGNSARRTHPVGEKLPNAWGLRDMHGHVWQWAADWFSGSYYAKAQRDDPPGPSASDSRALRGGDWSCKPAMLRSAFRGYLEPQDRTSNGGFRVVSGEGAQSLPRSMKQDLAPGSVLTIPAVQGWPNRALLVPGSQTALFSNSLQGCILWDLKTNKALRRFDKHGVFVHVWGLAVSADGKQVLSGDEKGKIFLWNLATGQQVRAFAHATGGIGHLAFIPESQRFASLDSGGDVRVWDMASGENRVTGNVAIKEGNDHFAIVFSSDASRLLIGQVDGTLKLFEVQTGKQLRDWKGHAARVTAAALSRDGRHALSGDSEGTIRLWDLKTEQEIATLGGHAGPIRSAAFSPDGRRALSGGEDRTVRVWDLATRKEVECFKGHTGPAMQIDISHDGRSALSMAAEREELAILWRLPPVTDSKEE